MKHVVAALIVNGDELLICQRTRHQPMPLKWEFPGGKVEDGEKPREALRRELEEELGIDTVIGAEVSQIRHQYKNGGTVQLQFFRVDEFENEIENRIFKDVRWAKLNELPSFDFLEADLELIHKLAAGKLL
jgi:8-oxo-dGTP diphosphatase